MSNTPSEDSQFPGGYVCGNWCEERASDRTSLTLGPGDRERARLSDLDLV